MSRSGGLALTYDPDGRLWQTSGGASGTTRFLYDGDQLVAEYDGSGNLLRRYLHGPGDDDPMVWFEGSAINLANKRSLSADERGSIIAVADQDGAPLAINAYDEYGIPSAPNVGRFQYTGQAWLPDLGCYYYKARIYCPTLGRFLQTDPVGYKDQLNLYAYVGNDSVNGRDPTGLATCGSSFNQTECSIIMAAQREALAETNATLKAVKKLQSERADIVSGKRTELSQGASRTEEVITNRIPGAVKDSDVSKLIYHLEFTVDYLSNSKYEYVKGDKGGNVDGHAWLGSSVRIDPNFFTTSFALRVETLTHEPNHVIGSNHLPPFWEYYGDQAYGLGNADTFTQIIKPVINGVIDG